MTANVARRNGGRSSGRNSHRRPRSEIIDATPSMFAELEDDGWRPAMGAVQSTAVVEERSPPQTAQDASADQVTRNTDNLVHQGQTDYFNAYQQWFTYATNLKDQVSKYQSELQKYSAYQIESERSAREVEKLQKDVEKLQTEALNSVDRFQPTSDSDISRAFEGVILSVDLMVALIWKSRSSISPSDWEAMACEITNAKSFDPARGIPSYEDKNLRRMVLKAVVWQWFYMELLSKVFGGYFGPEVDKLRCSYHYLFPEPRKDGDSSKWRSMTASKMETTQDPSEFDEMTEDIRTAFGVEVLASLGYNNQDGKLMGKVKDAIIKGAAFARCLSQQRAIFQLYWPEVAGTDLRKAVNDTDLTNMEDDKDQAEKAGQVWFISRPGLKKWGDRFGDNLETCMVLVKANARLADK